MSKVPSLHWWSCLRWSCMASEQALSRGCQADYAHQLLQLLQRHWNCSCSPCPWSLELHVHVITFSLFACLTAVNPEFITGFHPLGTFASKCHRSTFCCLPTRIVAFEAHVVDLFLQGISIEADECQLSMVLLLIVHLIVSSTSCHQRHSDQGEQPHRKTCYTFSICATWQHHRPRQGSATIWKAAASALQRFEPLGGKSHW